MTHSSYLLFKSNTTILSLVNRLLDPLSAVLLLLIIANIYREPFVTSLQIFSITVFLLVSLIFTLIGKYYPYKITPLKSIIFKLFFGWFVVLVSILTIGFTTKTTMILSRSLFLTWCSIAPFFLLFIHLTAQFIINLLVKSKFQTKSAVIVGVNKISLYLAKQIREYEGLGITLNGFFDNNLTSELSSITVIGTLSDLPEYVRQNHVDMVYFASTTSDEHLMELIDALQDTTACVYFVPSLLINSLSYCRSYEINGVPLISLWEVPFSRLQSFYKRIIDIIVSIMALVLLSPVMTIVAIAVKFSSPGPILFKQRRYGLNGQEIIIYKFRSMTVMENSDYVVQATRGDSRITPVGAFLRKTSLDELPQFLNVLQGYMSLVGPRPHAVAHNEKYRKLISGYMLRHKVKPGITGWAQVHGCRGETENLEKMKQRIDFDLEYLKIWSLELDFKILFKTLFIFLRDQNAY